MSPEDKNRLIRYLDFLEDELSDCPKLSQVSWRLYTSDRDLRRNLERWIENIVNCSIDIAKVLLASEGREIPGTYREILRALGSVSPFDEAFGRNISRWAVLRNILAHEYLDIRWQLVEEFLHKGEPVFRELVDKLKTTLGL